MAAEHEENDEGFSLETTEKGKTRQTIDNCVKVFRNDPYLQNAIKKNELTGKIDIVKNLGWKRHGSGITDNDIYQLQWYLERQYGLFHDKMINKAINIVANENSYHPVVDFLESLHWDGKLRIDNMLSRYLGVEENFYTREVIRLLMKAAIKRVYEPGCKFEMMVVLVGGQGAGKSSFFRLLSCCDDWFSDDLKKIDDENIYRKIQGHWFIEMSEMLATVNAKSIEDIKSFLSRQKETYKIPYETHPEDRPRQCIFVGTTNNIDFLPLDRTGNRRFAPIRVQAERKYKHILEDEQEARYYIRQAWAEAMEDYRNNPNHDLILSKEAENYLKELQKDFTPEDTKVGIIQEWLDHCNKEYVCTQMICEEALGKNKDEVSLVDSKIVGGIMNDCIEGWEKVSSHRFEGRYGIQRAWRKIYRPEFCDVTEESECPFEQEKLESLL